MRGSVQILSHCTRGVVDIFFSLKSYAVLTVSPGNFTVCFCGSFWDLTHKWGTLTGAHCQPVGLQIARKGQLLWVAPAQQKARDQTFWITCALQLQYCSAQADGFPGITRRAVQKIPKNSCFIFSFLSLFFFFKLIIFKTALRTKWHSAGKKEKSLPQERPESDLEILCLLCFTQGEIPVQRRPLPNRDAQESRATYLAREDLSVLASKKTQLPTKPSEMTKWVSFLSC